MQEHPPKPAFNRDVELTRIADRGERVLSMMREEMGVHPGLALEQEHRERLAKLEAKAARHAKRWGWITRWFA